MDQVKPKASNPRWSVMIPTYRRVDYLAETLRSVLLQRKSDAFMEIVVVDNASETSTVECLVAEIGGGLVRFVKNSRNLGAAGNWDRCVELAHGELVHILHDDDLVLPGFYDMVDDAMKLYGQAGMVATSAWFIDHSGKRIEGQPGIRVPDGVWREFSIVSANRNPVVCPGVVVKRAVFESIGRFRKDLDLLLDWEMWSRIGARYPVVGISTPLVEYRIHAKTNYDAGSRGLQWCREIRDLIREIHQRQRLKTKPSFGFVLIWGGRAVRATLEAGHSRWKAAKIAWQIFLLVPGGFSMRWFLRQCWSLLSQQGK